MSSPDINYPEQPSYGEGMAEALKAQAEFLRGTGDFADVGSLESLLPLEESIRRKTAQTDTDILRQTLLADDEVLTADDQGRVVEGFATDTGEVVGKLERVTPENQFEVYVDSNSDLRAQFNSPQAEGRTKAQFGQDHWNEFGQDENAIGERDFPEIGDEFALDADGQVTLNPQPVLSEPGTYNPGQQVRVNPGMVDILGDRRAVQEFDTKTATQADVDAGLADEVGETFVTQRDTRRQAGFDDQGQFQGLAALAEDIQRGNLSRQREADLQDVARLSGLYSDIMEDYKPGTQTAMQGAKDLIEEQKGNLLRDVGISDPAQVASQGVQADPLRQGLMTQAQEALGQGLTDRERREIAEAARARSTLMGRTFDQSAAIQEAEARVLEDNQRKMQNRAFAQSVLGQEAGIQTADDQRAMGADQFNVGTKMDSERLRESLRMQGLLGYLDAASRIQQMEDRDSLDPFQAILGRGGGTALQQGQSVFGQAGYGLQSSPQYLNPEAGLGFIQNQATNAANLAIADQAAKATAQAGMFQGIGSAIGGGLSKCWVAREVYGAHNPSWLLFRNWLDTKAPRWFDKLYLKFGERFAKFISNKPRLKARIRIWMDSKIRR